MQGAVQRSAERKRAPTAEARRRRRNGLAAVQRARWALLGVVLAVTSSVVVDAVVVMGRELDSACDG